MSRRCIVHFGPHKTGSSSIQSTLFHELNSDQFEYAKLGAANQSRILYTVFSDAPERYPKHRAAKMTAFSAEQFRLNLNRRFNSGLNAASESTIILSGEVVSKMSLDELSYMKKYLHQFFDDIWAVGYVRPPRALIGSRYQEQLKNHAVSMTPLGIRVAYMKSLEKFDRVFGRDNVKFWRFNASDFPDGDVVKHFFVSLGIPLPQRVRRVNESLPREAVQILYAFHKFGQRASPGAGRAAAKRQAIALLRGLSNTRFRLSPALLDPVIDRMRDDIAWAEARIGASLAEDRGDEAGAIGSEADMLDIAPEVIARLEEIVSARCDLPGRIDEPAPYAARLVERLMDAVASERVDPRRQRRASVAKADDEPVEG